MKQKLFGFDVIVSEKRGIPKRLREEVKEEDSNTCQVCFTPQHKLKSPKRRSTLAVPHDNDDYDTLQVHHIVKWPIGLTMLENLTLLCRRCQRDVHQIIDDHYSRKYLQEHLREIGKKAIEECRRKKKKLRDRGLLSADSD